MCGIAGTLDMKLGATTDPRVVERMTETLRHRGPDDGGTWTDGGVGLGSRRLAVIDLSPRARQPIANEDGQVRVVFNGELYNFLELRTELESKGHRFRSGTDTEVIVHLYEEEGVACVRRLDGMFAFALWDARARQLLLARDRLGQKPLCYYEAGPLLVFGSEPKAVLADPRVPAEPDLEALDHFLTYGYVPAPWSAFRHLRKLPPAHYLVARDGRTAIHRYWSLPYLPKYTGAREELVEELDALLDRAVRRRLVSDVPLGAMLSGGLDSSAVVALMRRSVTGPLRTFSIGFEAPEYDERSSARAVARRFDTEHHELVVRPDAAALLSRLAYHYNEPFADSSALPTWCLSELTRRSVTVALSGDGGDESFLGYDRYAGAQLAAHLDRVPAFGRRALAALARQLPAGGAKSMWSQLRRFGGGLAEPPPRRYGRWLAMTLDHQKRALCTPEFRALSGAPDSLGLLEAHWRGAEAAGVERLVATDIQMYLPDDLLVKMDIASMAHSLEVRSPFLDHHVVEFAARVPASFKLQRGRTKPLLADVVAPSLPPSVLRRRKMGFGVPIEHWLRGDLRELAHDLLLSSRALGRGYFVRGTLERYLSEHERGEAQHHMRVWGLMMLEQWHRTFIDRRPDGTASPASMTSGSV
tara:strand:- start:171 stop:2099 length:1929 start_codon:yes stop_codon:yes gene_type:complete